MLFFSRLKLEEEEEDTDSQSFFFFLCCRFYQIQTVLKTPPKLAARVEISDNKVNAQRGTVTSTTRAFVLPFYEDFFFKNILAKDRS